MNTLTAVDCAPSAITIASHVITKDFITATESVVALTTIPVTVTLQVAVDVCQDMSITRMAIVDALIVTIVVGTLVTYVVARVSAKNVRMGCMDRCAMVSAVAGV